MKKLDEEGTFEILRKLLGLPLLLEVMKKMGGEIIHVPKVIPKKVMKKHVRLLVSEGMSYSAVADELRLGHRTVERYMSEI